MPEHHADSEPIAFDRQTDGSAPLHAESASSSAVRFHRTGSDPIEAVAVLNEAYGGGRFTVRPVSPDFSFRYAYFGSERVTLRTSEMSGEVSGEIPFLADYVVSWFRFGRGALNSVSGARHETVGEPFLLPTEQRFELAFEPHLQNLVHFTAPFLEDVAAETRGGPRQPVAFDHAVQAQPQSLITWRAVLDKSTSVFAEADPGALVRHNAELALARALLELFPWRTWAVPDELRRAPAWRVRAALDYLQHHAHEPVSPADAARAAGLHTRTLQQATQHHLGLSPTAYLRNIRLDRAFLALLQGDPYSTTVAAVARTWGVRESRSVRGELLRTLRAEAQRDAAKVVRLWRHLATKRKAQVSFWKLSESP